MVNIVEPARVSENMRVVLTVVAISWSIAFVPLITVAPYVFSATDASAVAILLQNDFGAFMRFTVMSLIGAVVSLVAIAKLYPPPPKYELITGSNYVCNSCDKTFPDFNKRVNVTKNEVYMTCPHCMITLETRPRVKLNKPLIDEGDWPDIGLREMTDQELEEFQDAKKLLVDTKKASERRTTNIKCDQCDFTGRLVDVREHKKQVHGNGKGSTSTSTSASKKPQGRPRVGPPPGDPVTPSL